MYEPIGLIKRLVLDLPSLLAFFAIKLTVVK